MFQVLQIELVKTKISKYFSSLTKAVEPIRTQSIGGNGGRRFLRPGTRIGDPHSEGEIVVEVHHRCVMSKGFFFHFMLSFQPEDGQPAVHVLTQSPVDIIENYFNVSVGKSDLLHTPKSYPSPTHKYILSDMTLVWHMYGGEDFSNKSQARKNVKFEDRYKFKCLNRLLNF